MRIAGFRGLIADFPALAARGFESLTIRHYRWTVDSPHLQRQAGSDHLPGLL
jgi:hypothetical protein